MSGEPIPHWPGEFVSLGGYQVYVRAVPAESDITKTYEPADQDPEPALFVHGLEGSSRNWTDLMGLLRMRLAGEALDLPGFGNSVPRPDGSYSISALAQTVAKLIERRGRGPVHLFGNSLGGAVTLKVAARWPGLVRSLTLISPALPDPRLRLDLIRFPVLSAPGIGGWLLNKAQAFPPERRVANVISTCYYDPSSCEPARFAIEVAERAHRDTIGYADDALIGCARALTAENLRLGPAAPWRDAARVGVPVLVIYGSHDKLVSCRMAGRAAKAFPRGRIVVLPYTGHVAQMERPAAVAAEVMALLGLAALHASREFPVGPAG